ncbi:dual specificity protein phosphatase CDC14A-like [Galleria mellonella]|uniref:protein-tyrosine-phosphatase n=1 Tax=Galleria mellonella TaxID=7137 RepID=A0ABM3N682_GALME|nr:dual specificity protein phosphatase CDC14A-like [Galleria mellonella]
MSRNPDILFMAEYIKNVLYFATVRQGKMLKNTAEIHYFCIDNDLVYENYYSDFGPLNLGCVYKYCKILSDKLKQYLNKQIIVHYTSTDSKKKTNSAFLLGCYGVLYLSLTPRDALKPLTVHGQNYRPFQDAVQGDSSHTISILDCLQAIRKAQDLGFFNFQDFNYEDYDRLDKIQGGDLNWIVPGKFLAFIGPVDCSVSLYHPPEMYIDYFLNNNVKIVIRLNKRLYDSNIFSNVGITHYDLFFPDGSCPPRHILFKFLQISEEEDGAVAVHCKAGLGRTGSLIGCYLMKHYRMTSHEAIGWMRICRPGSVIGHQQDWLEQLEPWLLKQGNLYRKRFYQDTEKFPTHEFGVYSIAEKKHKQKPVIFHKSPSPPLPMQRQIRSEYIPHRPQASKPRREASYKAPEKEPSDWRVRIQKMPNSPKVQRSGDQNDVGGVMSRRGCSAGDSRGRLLLRGSTAKSQVQRHNSSNNFLMKSSIYKDKREKQLNASITITPRYTSRVSNYPENTGPENNTLSYFTPSSFNTVTRGPTQPQCRRRLGRSPSPPQICCGQTRATNTPVTSEKFLVRDTSKSRLREALSRLKLTGSRDGSIGAGSVGAASLGARRDAPTPKRAPRVRSDERPIATQGDMLNSIKFQRRLRDSLRSEKLNTLYNEKLSALIKDKTSIKNVNSKTNAGPRQGFNQEFRVPREKLNAASRGFCSPPRPSSPKGRRTIHSTFY